MTDDIVQKLLRRHATWLTALPAMHEAADELALLRAREAELVEALNASRRCMSMMASIIKCGEKWSDKAQHEFNAASVKARAALAQEVKEKGSYD